MFFSSSPYSCDYTVITTLQKLVQDNLTTDKYLDSGSLISDIFLSSAFTSMEGY